MHYTDEKYVKETLVTRASDAHKGNFGKVLIFAGSPGMAGAAVLCASSALRGGAGLVRILVDSYSSPIYPVLQTAVPEATCVEYSPDIDFSEYNAIAAGPGLGTSEHTADILKKILTGCTSSIVLDADALNIIAKYPEITELVRRSLAYVIITPHIGEARRLLKTDARIKTPEERREAAEALSEKYNAIAVLKGAESLVSFPGNKEEIYINPTGNPGMATGGSGDVLTGLIAALCAQEYTPLDAARLGVFLHGKAGDLAAEALSEPALISSDIYKYIPRAFKLYYRNAPKA